MNSTAYAFEAGGSEPALPLRRMGKADGIPSIRELMEDGIYLLFLLRSGNFPSDCAVFNDRVDHFLLTFDRVCATFGKPAEHVQSAKYAFCALLDELLLSPLSPLREDWQQHPLQLRLFGDHLAGEGFFVRLQDLRSDIARNVEVIEVFHTCMALGFRGRYVLEGSERFDHLVAQISREISAAAGRNLGFAPNWKLPFRFTEYVGRVVPMWLYGAFVAAVCLSFYLAFDWLLDRKLDQFPLPDPLPAGVLSEYRGQT